MSIPLDRLYNFLDSQNDYNVIIYRFAPHGSKKLKNLVPLKSHWLTWAQRMITPYMICHDQEPLDFDYYTEEEFAPYVNMSKSPYYNKVLKEANMHIRTMEDTMAINTHDYTLLCHSEKNSTNLNRYEAAGFIGVYWWAHAVIARDWFRYAEHDPALAPNFDAITHDFLVYNRAWSGTREYRLKLAELLADIAPSCLMTFAPDDGGHYTDHVFENTDFAITRNDLESVYPANTANSASSGDYDNKDYAKIGIELVAETLFDDQRWHLTEKILRPIACGRPFMLAATPGSLEYLRSYGFETFNGPINETYDSIIDPKDRLQTIVTEMKRINSLPKNDKIKLWTELYAIADRNRRRFFSDAWHDSIIKEYKDNFNSALSQVKQNQNGHYLKLLFEGAKHEQQLGAAFSRDIPGKWTVQELQDLARLIGYPKDS